MPTKLMNLDAEASILSCVLIDGDQKEVTEEIMTALTVDDFESVENKNLFLTMKKLFDKGLNIDFVSVADLLERNNKMDKVGGIETLTTISNLLPSNLNYKYYLQMLKDYSKLRALNKLTKDAAALIEEGKNAETVKKEIEQGLERMQESSNQKTVRHIEGQASEILAHIKDIKNGKPDDFGIATGFSTLDRMLWGLQKSELYIIAARAGAGKTAFAIDILNHTAKHKKVLFFSQEMSEREILHRLYAYETQIPLSAIRKAKGLSEKDLISLDQALKEFQKGKFFIDDSSSTVPEMTLKAKRLQRKQGLDLVVIDYLQFVKPTNKTGNRTQEVGDIARELKRMSRTLDVPVIALCQLNRQLDNEDREPTLADLRESGEIENNADVVMFLTNVGAKFDAVRKMELTIAKHRNGALAKIRYEFKGDTFTFAELHSEKKQTPDLIPIKQEELPF